MVTDIEDVVRDLGEWCQFNHTISKACGSRSSDRQHHIPVQSIRSASGKESIDEDHIPLLCAGVRYVGTSEVILILALISKEKHNARNCDQSAKPIFRTHRSNDK